jgi:DNA-binding transcriptional ArsR family regulator
LKTTVAICYFHRKIGPMVFYSYPEGNLDDKLATRIANIMDQTVSEGFFTHSFEQRNLMNYYFEIQSDWARGNRDMLMISIIFNRQINPVTELNVKILCTEFSEKLRANKEIFTAFYFNDINNFEEDDRELIQKNNALIKLWVKELYWATLEETREKSEEEKIASLLNKKNIFLTLKKLSKGPITEEGLREWYNDTFPNLNFTELIEKLEEKQFIFINQIGRVEKYVLLLKEVNAERIPPDSVIEYIDETPDQVERELIYLLLPKVQDYFSKYEKKTEKEVEQDVFALFQIVSDPKKYNVLSELRHGLISKDKLPKLLSKRTLDNLNSSLEDLKKNEVIEELKYKSERYIVLKTNIQITTSFPEYLRKLLPKESKPVVAKKFVPKEDEG